MTDPMLLAKMVRDLFVLASTFTVVLHIGLVGLAWLRQGGAEMTR